MMNHLMAINPGTAQERIDGIETTEPAFGLPAFWISSDQKDLAELRGYTVVEPVAVLATHLTEIVRQYAAELITRQDVQDLLDHHKQDSPGIVEEVLGKTGSLGPIQHVLQNLLREQIQSAFVQKAESCAESLRMYGGQPIMLVAPNLRLLIRRLVETKLPWLVVLSYQDVVADCPVAVKETLELGDVD